MTAGSLPEGLVERCERIIGTQKSLLGRFCTDEDLARAVLAVAAPALRAEGAAEAGAIPDAAAQDLVARYLVARQDFDEAVIALRGKAPGVDDKLFRAVVQAHDRCVTATRRAARARSPSSGTEAGT